MNILEQSITDGLQQALDNINSLNVTNLSDEMLTVLLGLKPLLKKWLTDAESEAISRAKNGCCLDGYVLRNSARRTIVDEQGAINALLAVDPALVPLCQKTTLLGINELKSCLGKDRFEKLFGPYMETRIWSKLVPQKPAK